MSRQGALAGASFFVAEETSFGMVSATDAREFDYVGLAALDWYPLQTLRSDIGGFSSGVKMTTYQPETTTARGGLAPAEVEAVVDSSGAVTKRIKGEFSLTIPLRWLDETLPANSAMSVLFDSALTSFYKSAGSTDNVLTTPSANVVTVADAGLYVAGDIVAVNTAGKFYFHRISQVDAGDDELTFVTPHGITDTGVLYHCHQWMPSYDGTMSGNTFSIIMADRGQTHEILAVGCRVTGISFKRVGSDESSVEVTLKCMAADGAYSENNSFELVTFTSPLPWGVTGTKSAKVLNAPVVASGVGTTAPWSGAQHLLPTRTWSADCTFTMDPRGGGQATRSGMNDYDLTRGDVTVAVTMDPDPGTLSYRNWLKDSQGRSLTLAIGGAVDSGNCGCIHLARADIAEDPGLTIDDERKSFSVNFRNGQYEGDIASGTQLKTNAPWCIAFVA